MCGKIFFFRLSSQHFWRVCQKGPLEYKKNPVSYTKSHISYEKSPEKRDLLLKDFEPAVHFERRVKWDQLHMERTLFAI